MTRVRVRLSDEELAELLALASEMDLSPNLVMRTALALLADDMRAARCEPR
jgi:predicted transcriptional regulator